MVLAEHGDPSLALPLSVTLAGSVVYDIATAPSAVRRYNERHPDSPRVPERALMLSLASTVVPVLAGTGALSRNAYVPGGVLVYSGLVLGPSVGHWYAGRWGRGLASAALRFGLLTAAGYVVLTAS